MKKVILIILGVTFISVSACSSNEANLTKSQPSIKQVKYNCARGSTLSVSFTNHTSKNKEKPLAIINGFGKKPIILKKQKSKSEFLYTNGKFTLQGNKNEITWTVGKMMPIQCWPSDRKNSSKK